MSKTYSFGLVGFPNVGKSSMFNFFSKSNQAKSENYAFCTIEPNEAIIQYQDKRIDKLSEISQSNKKIYSSIKIVDIAGLVEGASRGEGLGNQFLHNIRETDCIIHVARCFVEEDVMHVMDRIDPVEDLNIIFTELKLADLETLDKMKSKAKKDNDLLLKIEKAEKMINSEIFEITDLPLLSSKPFIVLGNGIDEKHVNKLKEFCEKRNIIFVNFDVTNGSQEDVDKVLKIIFELLNIIFYFTTGKQETRSWAITKGTNAKDAAAEIHTDISDKFIKAEVYNFSEIKPGIKPRVRQEGKDYIVIDGDIIVFKHNG